MNERAALMLALLLASGAVGCAQAETPEGPSITIRDQRVALEVVRTSAEQSKGLGYRDSLDWGRGMLFVYDAPRFVSFWMKGMRFDIDIVWIRDGRIVGIESFVPYPRDNPSQPASVRPKELVDNVLEVPAGFAQAHGWRPGDAVRLAGIPGPGGTGN
jgi:hypothetical protein